MSLFRYFQMKENFASLIVNWTYEEPYSLYSMDGMDSISELMNGDYYYVLSDENDLYGFICIGNSARVPGGYRIGIYNNDKYIDLGLGLSPELTGKGIGLNFLTSSIHFIGEQYKSSDIQLVVARFNERAIKVYESAGFIIGQSFKSEFEDQEMEFLVMSYSSKNNDY